MMFKPTIVSCDFGGKKLSIETGRLAKQADGAVLVTYGETMVLVTAVSASEPKQGIDFFPLTVEYQEKFYAAGRIPGGFFKREGRPTTEATLTSRLIDRPIRPLFPEGYRYDTQVIATVLSVDKEHDPDVVASIGASAALSLSSIPFSGPTAACRVGRVNGELICNPTLAQQEQSDIDVFVAGTKAAIMMVEGGAKVVPEEEVLDAILFGHKSMQPVIAAIAELRSKAGKEKRAFEPKLPETGFKDAAEKIMLPLVLNALATQDKGERYSLYDKAYDAAKAQLIKEGDENAAEREKELAAVLENAKYAQMREMILAKGHRIDGRDLVSVRPIAVEAHPLPRVHGSALFTRGETQVLAAVTLGTGDDEQMIDGMRGTYHKKFMLNYNFPPFSVGETGRVGTPGRREVGHGALAERALANVMPTGEACPYTVRVVCEVLESNGSSSMGSVCSGSMALMDAGIAFREPVAGIAMGLIKEGGRVAVLSDILGDEDHLGDMDFKVAGTKKGITAIQMDIKIEGVNEQIMRTALKQAHDGRMHILEKMASAIIRPREQVSDYAPTFTVLKIKPDKIRDVIGSGGKVIKGIIEQTGVKIDVEDDGTVRIASTDPVQGRKAEDIIRGIVSEPEVGRVYSGTVRSIVEFGAFIEITPGTDGLLHVSEIAHHRVNNVRDVLKEGEKIDVKVLEVDRNGKVRLSRKVLLEKPAGMSNEPMGGGGDGRGGSPSGHGGGPRGPQGGHRGGGGGGRPVGSGGGSRPPMSSTTGSASMLQPSGPIAHSHVQQPRQPSKEQEPLLSNELETTGDGTQPQA